MIWSRAELRRKPNFTSLGWNER